MKASETLFMPLWWGIDLGKARPIDMYYEAEDDYSFSKISNETFQNNVYFCGETVESFLYRIWIIWIENVIWFGQEEDGEMGEAQKAYLAHYEKPA